MKSRGSSFVTSEVYPYGRKQGSVPWSAPARDLGRGQAPCPSKAQDKARVPHRPFANRLRSGAAWRIVGKEMIRPDQTFKSQVYDAHWH